jgi:hypothetical protein
VSSGAGAAAEAIKIKIVPGGQPYWLTEGVFRGEASSVSFTHTLFPALVQEHVIKSYEPKSSPVVSLPRRPLGWSAYHEVEAEFLRVCLLLTVYSRDDAALPHQIVQSIQYGFP